MLTPPNLRVGTERFVGHKGATRKIKGRGEPVKESPFSPIPGEKPQRVSPATLTQEVGSEPGYVYHATNEERLNEIRDSGKLDIHKPSFGTDQSSWPDGSTNKRSYFSRKANVVWQFAPEDGKPVLIRARETPDFKTESTGDVYSEKSVPSHKLEYLGEDQNWHSLKE